MMNSQKTSTIDTKHEGMIHDAQYDYYGKRLATCSTDGKPISFSALKYVCGGTIQIFDVSKGDISKGDNVPKLCTFKAHSGPIWQVCWAHPKFGSIFATCSFDRKVIIWKEVKQNDWQEVTSFEHQGSVNGIAWAPWECGLKLAACSADGCVSLLSRKSDDTWEKAIKFQAHELGVNSISWAPLITADDLFGEQNIDKYNLLPKLATGSCDKSVKIWEYRKDEPTSFAEVLCLKDHNDWVRDVSFCPSIGAPYDVLVSCSEDQTVIFYRNNESGSNKFEIIDTKKHEGPVWRLSWSFGGNMLAVSSACGDSENVVDIYRENEQGEWEKLSRIQDDSVVPAN